MGHLRPPPNVSFSEPLCLSPSARPNIDPPCNVRFIIDQRVPVTLPSSQRLGYIWGKTTAADKSDLNADIVVGFQS